MRPILLAGLSILMLATCIGMEVTGSLAPRPGFVGVCGLAVLLTAFDLFTMSRRIKALEDGKTEASS